MKVFSFEVGKTYEWADRGFDPIKVLQRTAKMIKVTNGNCVWRMRIRIADSGDAEYVVDSSVPVKYRDCFTCCAKWEVES